MEAEERAGECDAAVVEAAASAGDEDTVGREEDAAGRVMWTMTRRRRSKWKTKQEAKTDVVSPWWLWKWSAVAATGRGEEQSKVW